MPSSTFADRLLVSLIKRRHLSQLALRAVLKANQLLGLTFGLQLAEKRDSRERWQVVFAQCKEHDFLGLVFQEAAEILGLRWDKIPDKRRPQYSPELRYRILRLKALLAVAAHGLPRHFVSDRGTQFTANHFRAALRRLSIRQRFSAVGATGAIALVERLWRSVKALFRLGLIRPFHRQDMEQRLRLVLFYYAYLRPHQGLGGATPAEVYFGRRPAHLAAVPPPRGRPGEGESEEFPFRISFLDSEERLPFLLRKAA